MENTQTLLENYVPINERPKRNAGNIQMREKQNELESLPENMNIKKKKQRTKTIRLS